jgi:WD40-like Beta Propeller Repeat
MGRIQPAEHSGDGVWVAGLDALEDGEFLWLLHRHPDGRHVALRTATVPEWAGVWDVPTGRLVWRPDGAVAAAWLPVGDQLVALRDEPEPIPDMPTRTQVRPFWERRTWPGDVPVARFPLRLPTGWPDRVVPSPRGNLAAVRWLEQDCAGVVLVTVAEEGDRQLGAGYRTEPNLIQGPAFSPDGRYLALSCARSSWWNPGDPESPSPGGRLAIGRVAVLDLRDPAAPVVTERAVADEVAPGWSPDDEQFERDELIGSPRFVSNREFTVRLPTGTEARFSVS